MNSQPTRSSLSTGSFCGRTRREFLSTVGGGFVQLAMAGLLAPCGAWASPPTTARAGLHSAAPHPPFLPPKAKSVIFLFMYGGPSHVDTFDHKPTLNRLDGKTIQVKTKGRGGEKNEGRIVGSPWGSRQHGQSGAWVSDLFPHLASCVDDIVFLKSMTADSPIHGSAMLMMNAGSIQSGKPSLGSWVNYGLGSENESLPGYVVMLDRSGGPISGAKNWSSGYMPASFQGTVFRAKGNPILDLKHVSGMSVLEQTLLLSHLKHFNGEHFKSRFDQSALSARMASYELAFKMQAAAPEAVDLQDEAPAIRRLYGIDEEPTDDFGKKCLLARRLVERGVRFIQVYSGGAHNDSNWDAHDDLKKNHDYHAGNTDKPIAGLLKDLKQRGLLDSTLVVWGGEFGRQPTAEYAHGTGRDHNSLGFTMWMAGGGLKGGMSFGETDELGSAAVVQPLHVKHLHATILHQLGIDPNRLSYFHGGLDQKLVGVEAVEPIYPIIA